MDDDMNDIRSSAKGSRYYQQLKAMVDINDYGSWVRALNAMNNLGLWMT